MGIEDFTEPYCEVFARYHTGLAPTEHDREVLEHAIGSFKTATVADASPHLKMFLQALLLESLWAKRNINDKNIHTYLENLLWRFLPMNDDLKANRFFYLELTDEVAENHGMKHPNTRGVWRRKGDASLLIGGLFGDYVRAPRPPSNRYFPGEQETRKRGITAYSCASQLFSQFHDAEERNLSHICESIAKQYAIIEDSLYSLGRTHFFPAQSKEHEITTPLPRKVKGHYNLDKPIPPTIGEMIKRSKIATLYRRMRDKGYFD